jgi:hypothetical protein
MEKLIHHNLQFIAGHTAGTMDWFPTDSKELYQKNLNNSDSRQLLERFGWIDANISYIHNSHGFRTREFVQTENFVTLGCSLTYGIGLPQHCAWPEILGQMVNIPVFNLGLAGGSPDTCYRTAKHYISFLKPKFVAMLLPNKDRMELFLGDSVYVHLPSNPDYHTFAKNDSWIKHWCTNEQNSTILAQKNIDAIAWICKQNQVDFYLVDQNLAYNYHGAQLDLARDLMHPGKIFHETLAQTFFKKIQNKNVYE